MSIEEKFKNDDGIVSYLCGLIIILGILLVIIGGLSNHNSTTTTNSTSNTTKTDPILSKYPNATKITDNFYIDKKVKVEKINDLYQLKENGKLYGSVMFFDASADNTPDNIVEANAYVGHAFYYDNNKKIVYFDPFDAELVEIDGKYILTNNKPYNKRDKLINDAISTDFDALKSWKNDNIGKAVKIYGKIMQNQESMALIQNDNYDIIYCNGDFSDYGEDEYVTVYGFYNGMYTYTTAIGGSKKVPSLSDCIIKY
ncbi:MAG: hypothetical protein LBC39_07655 [Methanobrevibacter sp.]|jgi:hypothetical protein|nr:hypothetical protein [Candidatus Methanovirga aequatorialis]